jgi:hypothetical protein
VVPHQARELTARAQVLPKRIKREASDCNRSVQPNEITKAATIIPNAMIRIHPQHPLSCFGDPVLPIGRPQFGQVGALLDT